MTGERETKTMTEKGFPKVKLCFVEINCRKSKKNYVGEYPIIFRGMILVLFFRNLLALIFDQLNSIN